MNDLPNKETTPDVTGADTIDDADIAADMDKLNALADEETPPDDCADEHHANLNDEGCFEQNDDRGPFISTLSGAKFFVNECNVQDVPITDIANALALNCRFNGHILRHYSVAEHSVLISELVSPENALYGLLHDYAEAFVSDVPRPFKASITGHNEFEAAVMANVCDLYGLPLEMPEEVAYIDTHICAVEVRMLTVKEPEWVQYYDPSICSTDRIQCLSHIQARNAFMNRFNELTQ